MADQPPTIPYNPDMPEFRLKDLLNLFKKDIMKSVNCHAIATIQSFNSGINDSPRRPARVTATMPYQKTDFVQNASGQYVPSLSAYPILVDCPAVILGGGGTRITFPISAGDEALICFNDRDLDNWYQGYLNQGVATARTHSFSDGVAIVGLYNTNRALTVYDAVRAVITNGTTSLGINPATNKIAATNGVSLGTILGRLVTAIEQLQTLNGLVPPSAPYTLAQIATQLQGLLE